MLSRKYKLKRDNDFRKVFKQGRYYHGNFIRIKILKNELDVSRFGFIVGLKISKKATERNKIRRRLEQAVRLNLNQIKDGFDVVVLAEKEIKEKEYLSIEEVLLNLFQKAKLWKS